MDVSSQIIARWRNFWNPSVGTSTTASDNRQSWNDTHSSKPVETSQLFVPARPFNEVAIRNTSIMRVDPSVNARMSPLLRLPAELRNQIYSYTNYSECIIQVLSLSKTGYNALDTKGAPLLHNPYPNDTLWYRIEQAAIEEFTLDNPNIDTRRKRCASICGLFALSSVCYQIRAETMLLHIEGPSFAFSDTHFNYNKAFPLFLESLSLRERNAVRSIHWPLRQARECYHRSLKDKPMEAPDQAFIDEFRELPYLQGVVLQYLATDVGGLRLTGHDVAELEGLVADVGEGKLYQVEREFRRELAVRGMMWQISHKDGVNVRCEKRRVAF